MNRPEADTFKTLILGKFYINQKKILNTKPPLTTTKI